MHLRLFRVPDSILKQIQWRSWLRGGWKRAKGLRWWQWLIVLFSLWAMTVSLSVLFYAWQRDEQPADAAIVMGAAVYRDRPSPVFRERINHAIVLYQEGKVNALIFTGGQDAYDSIAESEAARAYAIQAGVAPDDIFVETVSTDTEENLSEAEQIAATQNFERVLIVSDPMHMRRAVTVARDVGLDAHPSPTPTSRYRSVWSNFWFWMRESYFYGLYLLDGYTNK
jgi:uncharacterized SAM-binding protein YcdF (DUF218 family)